MTTIVERDSGGPAVLVIFLLLLLLVGGGLGLTYIINGAFGERTTVVENTKTVENKTVILPAQSPPPAPERTPERAPEPEKSVSQWPPARLQSVQLTTSAVQVLI